MRTTININRKLKEKLKKTAEILNISTNDIIALLLQKISSRNVLDVAAFKGIQYQDADPEKKWTRLHVRFELPVYELGLDLRKCFKLSVSFIISFAIVNFLNELVEEFQNPENVDLKVDNYPLNYMFITKMFNDVQGYIILWGIPDEKNLKYLIS